MRSLADVVGFLDRELDIVRFEDRSNNGLQVANPGKVKKVCCGVDASMELFEAAKERKADLVIVHHGLSWDDSLKYITGRNYRCIQFLIKNGIALYASHLPLDAHPRWGNNAQIFRALKLRDRQRFGRYHGMDLGYRGKLAKPVRLETLKQAIANITGAELRTMEFGKKTVHSVAIVSGGAADHVVEAAEAGIDVFLSGEAKLSAYVSAQDYGINAIFADHYATEAFGVRALAGVLKRRFHLDAEFVDLNIPF